MASYQTAEPHLTLHANVCPMWHIFRFFIYTFKIPTLKSLNFSKENIKFVHSQKWDCVKPVVIILLHCRIYNSFVVSNTEVWNFYKEDKHLNEIINAGIHVNIT